MGCGSTRALWVEQAKSLRETHEKLADLNAKAERLAAVSQKNSAHGSLFLDDALQ